MENKIVVTISVLLFVIFSLGAQEREEVTKRLEAKYYFVCFHSTNGGWYSIRTSYGNKRNAGACDLKGNEVIPPLYDDVSFNADNFKMDDYYKVKIDGKVGIRSLSNRELVPCKYDKISWYSIGIYGCCDVEQNGKKGLLDDSGKEIVTCKYDNVEYSQFSGNDGYAKVKLNGKCGIVDKKGTEIIPCRYDSVDISHLKENFYILVTLNSKYGVVNKLGTEIIPCKYDYVDGFHLEDRLYIMVGQKGKYGLVYKMDGHEVVSCKYDNVDYWSHGYCEVALDSKKGIINIEGKEVIPCKYDNISNHHLEGDGYIVIVELNGKQGVVTTDGREVISCQYDKINSCFLDDNLLVVTQNDKKGLVQQNGKVLTSCMYADIEKANEGLLAFNKGGVFKDNKIVGGKWGYMDLQGKEVIEAKYDKYGTFSDGIAQVVLNGASTILSNPITGTKLKITHHVVAVDSNIPQIEKPSGNTFAFIVANEAYLGCSSVYSANDEKIVKEYCRKRFGIPEQNIRFYEDATYGNLVSMVKRMKDIADAYDGDATIIFYYSGLGATDEKTSESYLLPVDASLETLSVTGYSLNKLYMEMGRLKTQLTLVLLDACFSGCDKTGNMLMTSRGVRVNMQNPIPSGNMIVFNASSAEQIAYASEEMQHGLFTYLLLEKLQASQKEIALKDLSDYVITRAKQKSLKLFSSLQTPVISVSKELKDTWSVLKF